MNIKSTFWGKPSTVLSCNLSVIYEQQSALNIINQEIAVHPNQYISSHQRIADVTLRQNICLAVKPWMEGQVFADSVVRVQHQDYLIEAYAPRKTVSCSVVVETEERTYKAWLTEMASGYIFVTFEKVPAEFAKQYKYQNLRKRLIREFKNKFCATQNIESEIAPISESAGKIEPTVSFHDLDQENGTCLADILYDDGSEMRDIQVLFLGGNNIDAHQLCQDTKRRRPVPGDVRALIHSAFFNLLDPSEFSAYRSANQAKKVETTKFGRVKNAISDSVLTFRRNQVLREVYILCGKKKTCKPLNTLQEISAFEIDVLSWINELRYVTSDMLIDLVEAGLISIGALGLKRTKLQKQMEKLNSYGLVDISVFATLDDDGKLVEDPSTRSIARIYTLGKNGATLLSELNRGNWYNPFERFQDGNVVKAILAVNQWLVYWLAAYPQELINHYQSSRIVYIRDAQINGARLHASVVREDSIIVGEPIRRTDQKEKEEWIRDKFERVLAVFNAHHSALYCSHNAVEFPPNKILCYICEDEAHIEEVYQVLLPSLQKCHGQEVWFTTDLKLHNYNEEGKRFIMFNSASQKEYVDIKQRLSLGKERAWQEADTD